MSIRKDFRDLKKITREITGWAREIEAAGAKNRQAQMINAAARPKPPRPAPAPPADVMPSLPGEYSFVTCKDCDSPAMLIRGHHSFAALCPSCRVITHLETISEDQEPRK